MTPRQQGGSSGSGEFAILGEVLNVVRDHTEAIRGVGENAREYRQHSDEVMRVLNELTLNFARGMDNLQRILSFLESNREKLVNVPEESLEKIRNLQSELHSVLDNTKSIKEKTKDIESNTKKIEEEIGVITEWISKKIPIFITIMMCFATAVGYIFSIQEVADKYAPVLEKMVREDKKLSDEMSRIINMIENNKTLPCDKAK